MLPQQGAPINIIPPEVAGQVERKRSLHEEMGARGLLVKQGSGMQNQPQNLGPDYAAGPLQAQRPMGQLPPQGMQAAPLPPQAVQEFQVGGQLPFGLPNVGVTPVPVDPFIQKSQGIRPGEGLLYDARGLPLDAQGYLPNTGPTIGQRMRDAAHIGEPNGQPNYVDVHSISMQQQALPPQVAGGSIQQGMVREREFIRDQGALPPQQLPPQQFQGGQFVQEQRVWVANPPEVPVKGVGFIDKAYMGLHNLKEHLKDKLFAHQQTREMKKLAEAEMIREREALEARQMPVKAQLEAERKALAQQHDMAVGGVKSELAVQMTTLEQKQAAIKAQLEAERQEFLRVQESKLAAMQSQFDAERAGLEQQLAGVEQQLAAERQGLRQHQDQAAVGIEDQLLAKRKEIEAAGLQKRAVENQVFVNQVMAEHQQDALAKETRLGLKAERYAVEANLAEQAKLEKQAVKQEAAMVTQAVEQQAMMEGQMMQQQAAGLVQQQQQFIQQPPQQFIQQGQQQFIQQPQQIIQQAPATIVEKETRIIKEDVLPARQNLQGYGQQAASGFVGGINQAVGTGSGYVSQGVNQGAGYMQQGGQMLQQGGQFIDQYGNTVERKVSNDVKNIRGGQEFKQTEKDIVRDPSGRVIADAKNIEKDVVKETKGKSEVKHEQKTKVDEHI